MQETGVVIASKNGNVSISFSAKEACGSCSMNSSCLDSGTGTERVLEVADSVGAQVGQKVMVEMEGSRLLLGWSILYLFPMIALVGGMLIGYFAGGFYGYSTDMASLFGGVLTIVIYFLIFSRISGNISNRFKPHVVQIVQ